MCNMVYMAFPALERASRIYLVFSDGFLRMGAWVLALEGLGSWGAVSNELCSVSEAGNACHQLEYQKKKLPEDREEVRRPPVMAGV